jgi:hypothetical protein
MRKLFLRGQFSRLLSLRVRFLVHPLDNKTLTQKTLFLINIQNIKYIKQIK